MTTPRTVVVFGRLHQPGIADLMTGLTVYGPSVRGVLVRPVHTPSDPLLAADHVVTFGLRGVAQPIATAYRAQGVPITIIDLPRLRVGAWRERLGLFRETLHHLPLCTGNEAHVLPPLLRTKATKKGMVTLLCGQKPGDMAHGLTPEAMDVLMAGAARVARTTYGLPVVYRPHPYTDHDLTPMVRDAVDAVEVPQVVPLARALEQAAAVVTYNSTCGWDAIMAGVPAVHIAPATQTSWAEYGTLLGQPLRVLTAPERITALQRAAACEFTLDQLRDGTAVGCMLGDTVPPAPSMTLHARDEELAPCL